MLARYDAAEADRIIEAKASWDTKQGFGESGLGDFKLMQEREEGMSMFNPDAPNDPTMKLYKCWDSSVVITDDEHSRLVIRERSAQLAADAIITRGAASSGEGGQAPREKPPKKEKTIAQQAKAAPIPNYRFNLHVVL